MKLFEASVARIIQSDLLARKLGEQETMIYIVLPILQSLGYDAFSPDDIGYEYRACLRTDKRERCDLVIFGESREPLIMVEIKSHEKKLDDSVGQIKAYFVSADTAKYAILTNGIEFWIYHRSQKEHIQSASPILKISLRNMRDEDLFFWGSIRKNELRKNYNEELILSRIKVDIKNNYELENNLSFPSGSIARKKIDIETKLDDSVSSQNDEKERRNEFYSTKNIIFDSVEAYTVDKTAEFFVGKTTNFVYEGYADFCRSSNYERVSSAKFVRQINHKFVLYTQQRKEGKVYVNSEYLKWEEEYQRMMDEEKLQETTKIKLPINKNSVEKFCSQNMNLDVRYKSNTEVYDMYIKFCKENQLKAESKIKFSRTITSFYNLRIKTARDGKKIFRIYY